jgi:hypothetical protein
VVNASFVSGLSFIRLNVSTVSQEREGAVGATSYACVTSDAEEGETRHPRKTVTAIHRHASLFILRMNASLGKEIQSSDMIISIW